MAALLFFIVSLIIFPLENILSLWRGKKGQRNTMQKPLTH